MAEEKKATKYGMTPEKATEVFGGDSKLKKIRVKKGMSQFDLAEASGVKKRAIQTYEQGERDLDGARLETLCDLCLAMGCKLEDILEGETLIEKFKKVK